MNIPLRNRKPSKTCPAESFGGKKSGKGNHPSVLSHSTIRRAGLTPAPAPARPPPSGPSGPPAPPRSAPFLPSGAAAPDSRSQPRPAPARAAPPRPPSQRSPARACGRAFPAPCCRRPAWPASPSLAGRAADGRPPRAPEWRGIWHSRTGSRGWSRLKAPRYGWRIYRRNSGRARRRSACPRSPRGRIRSIRARRRPDGSSARRARAD